MYRPKTRFCNYIVDVTVIARIRNSRRCLRGYSISTVSGSQDNIIDFGCVPVRGYYNSTIRFDILLNVDDIALLFSEYDDRIQMLSFNDDGCR